MASANKRKSPSVMPSKLVVAVCFSLCVMLGFAGGYLTSKWTHPGGSQLQQGPLEQPKASPGKHSNIELETQDALKAMREDRRTRLSAVLRGEGKTLPPSLLTQYRKRLESEPDNPLLLYIVGRYSKSETERIEFYKRAISINPDYAWPYYGLSKIFLTQGDYGKAFTYAEKADKLISSGKVDAISDHYWRLQNFQTGWFKQDISSWQGLNSYECYKSVIDNTVKACLRMTISSVDKGFHCMKFVDKYRISKWKHAGLVCLEIDLEGSRFSRQFKSVLACGSNLIVKDSNNQKIDSWTTGGSCESLTKSNPMMSLHLAIGIGKGQTISKLIYDSSTVGSSIGLR